VLFSTLGSGGILRAAAEGGEAVAVTHVDASRGELNHSQVSFLPDGRHFLYYAGGQGEPIGLFVGSLDSPNRVRLFERGSRARYAAGHLFFTRDKDRQAYMKASPGLGIACVEWLHAREVAAVAADTMLVEVMPWEDASLVLPLHMLCIRDMGLTLGEMFDLDALAADCAQDGVWEFLFSAPPLKVVGGVGSPLNPLAVK